MISNLRNISNKNEINKIISSSDYVVLDFYADWCPPCKAIAPIIEDISKEMPDVNFIKINIDEEDGPELGEEYKISSIPTLIYFKKGQQLKEKTLGLVNKQFLIKSINNLIAKD